jgi:hypothetical protein
MTAAMIFEHLIATYAVVVAPWLAVRKMRRVRADVTAVSKIDLYRRAIFMQFLTVGYERRRKNRPQSAARAAFCGGVKVVHRRNLVS